MKSKYTAASQISDDERSRKFAFPEIDAARLRIISPTLTWLKWLAVLAMFFDHAAFGVLIRMPPTPDEPIWRLAGRVSMPIFAFLVAFNLQYFTSNKKLFVLRLWIFAVISEPLFHAYFGIDGNAFLPLAIGATLVLASEKADTYIKRFWFYSFCAFGYAMSLFSMDSFEVAVISGIVWLFAIFVRNRHVLMLLGIYGLALLSNSFSLRNAIVLLATIGLILLALNATKAWPRLKMNKWFGYLFYPAHLALLLVASRVL